MKYIKILVLVTVMLMFCVFVGCEEKQSVELELDENGEGYCLSGVIDEEMTHIQIPDKYRKKTVTAIMPEALKNNKKVTEITIPQTVISIGDSAFFGCKNLEKIIYSGTKDQWETIKKGNNWEYGTDELTIVCTDGMFILLNGTYKTDEVLGTYVSCTFSGSKVTCTTYVLGTKAIETTGTYEINGDEITFTWENSEDSKDAVSGTQTFEKTDDGIKIGVQTLKKA